MIIFKIIMLIFNVFLFMYGAHFVIFGIFPYFKKRPSRKDQKPFHRFAIIIPARNEEIVIPELVESLKQQNYPQNMYQIYVIPNNCTDKTKDASVKAGAKILEIKKKVKSKGEVLNYAFQKLQNDESFDTYVIFDADNVVHPNFLMEINNEMENGYQVVQGCRDTKNLYDTWLSSSYALSYYLQNLFLYEPRIRMGASANLNGTGYAISKEIIKKTNYKANTLTEDIELMTVCAINNIKIGYAPKALFYDEQVSTFVSSIKQRKRWNVGTLQILKNYGKDLIKGFIKNKNIHAIDCFYLILGPVFQLIVAITTIANFFLVPNFWLIILSGFLSYIGTVTISTFMIAVYQKKILKSLKGILFFPLFAITGIISVLLAIIMPSQKWEEIKHTRKIKIIELLENK